MPLPRALIVVNARSSSPPHRHAVEPNTSPVRHSTWTCKSIGTFGTGLADDHDQVLAAVGSWVHITETDDAGGARLGGQDRLCRPDGLWLGTPSIRHEVVDRDHAQTVSLRELDQLGAAGHRVGVFAGDDLAQRSRRSPAGQPGQIHRRLGGSRSSQYPVVAGPHRNHVTRAPEVGRVATASAASAAMVLARSVAEMPVPVPHQSTATRSAAPDPVALAVAHGRQVQPVALRARQGDADVTGGMPDGEGEQSGRCGLGGEYDISLFAMRRVVGDDDRTARRDRGDRAPHAHIGGSHLEHHAISRR